MDDEPDIFDLTEWLAEHQPEMHEAMRYLHVSSYYAAALQVWRQAQQKVEKV